MYLLIMDHFFDTRVFIDWQFQKVCSLVIGIAVEILQDYELRVILILAIH